MAAPPPRLVPHRPFPAYSYTGPPDPHPFLDPRGHGHGAAQSPPPPLDPERFEESEEYLFGIDLFNRGYYWEAHDAWEGLWKAGGKRGAVPEFLKGLIKLAAGGMKARQASPGGVRKHARSALRHFQAVEGHFPTGVCAGLRLPVLKELAREAGEKAPLRKARLGPEASPLFDRFLVPVSKKGGSKG